MTNPSREQLARVLRVPFHIGHGVVGRVQGLEHDPAAVANLLDGGGDGRIVQLAGFQVVRAVLEMELGDAILQETDLGGDVVTLGAAGVVAVVVDLHGLATIPPSWKPCSRPGQSSSKPHRGRTQSRKCRAGTAARTGSLELTRAPDDVGRCAFLSRPSKCRPWLVSHRMNGSDPASALE